MSQTAPMRILVVDDIQVNRKLLCAMLEVGIDRILFSVDWPFVDNGSGMEWMHTVPLSNEDKQKMFNGNARKLLRL